MAEDSMQNMSIELSALVDEFVAGMKDNQDMKITEKSKLNFTKRLVAICIKNEFTKNKYKVMDRCHITGACRGADHNMCNINFSSNRYLPVFFHNLKGYDGHLIIREALKNKQ